MFGPNQSFEPRVGTAQMIFGVIYTIITLIALCLAYYVTLEGRTPYLHLFMALLFAIMALKSFIIYKRVKTLMANGQYAEAEVSSIEPVRGITVIKGTCALPNGDRIEIESRLVGETAAKELKAYLAEQKQSKLPALVVGVDGPRPRGMFTVKCLHGHLIEASAHLKSAPPKDSAADDEATARAKAATRAAEEQKQAEQAQAEQTKAEEQPEVAPRDDKRDAAIMDALAQAEQKK